jgi:hypothetical protein
VNGASHHPDRAPNLLKRRVSSEDPAVSVIGLGTTGLAGASGPAAEGEAIATIGQALDVGVTLLTRHGQGSVGALRDVALIGGAALVQAGG